MMKVIFKTIKDSFAKTPKSYLLPVTAVIILAILITMLVIGWVSFLIVAFLLYFPAWATTGYYIISKKESAPLWADKWCWYCSPIAGACLIVALVDGALRTLIIGLVIALTGICLIVYNKQIANWTKQLAKSEKKEV